MTDATRNASSTVMVVEDNELNLRLFCDLLMTQGMTPVPVNDGRDVMQRARDVRPQLIIMDIQLPHVSGLELIATLKEEPDFAAVPILAVTAYAGREDEARIRAAGAEAYIAKPISVMRFIEAVGQLLPASYYRNSLVARISARHRPAPRNDSFG